MSQNDKPEIYKVDFKKRAADKVRRKFLDFAIAQAEIDVDMAGFVIVSWDKRGAATSCLFTRDSPISQDMLGLYVAAEISRRIAIREATDDVLKQLGYPSTSA